MTIQILRYGALALVSVCLIMVALVVGGLVPLETVRNAMSKVPALVQFIPERHAEVAKVEDAAVEGIASESASADPADETLDDATAEQTAKTVPVPEGSDSSRTDENPDTDTEAEGPGAAADNTVVPAFDILRVERGGSVVAAGRAAPGSNIELRNGAGEVVGSGKAGPSGDFVIVPDNPLPSGDHSLALVVTDENGKETVSTERATVSVPDDQGGDVLAMVTKPGEASRIVAKPETLQADETGSDAAGSGNDQDEYSVAKQEDTTTEDTDGAGQPVEDSQTAGVEQSGKGTASSQPEVTSTDGRTKTDDGPTGQRDGEEDQAAEVALAGEGERGIAAEQAGEISASSQLGTKAADAGTGTEDAATALPEVASGPTAKETAEAGDGNGEQQTAALDPQSDEDRQGTTADETQDMTAEGESAAGVDQAPTARVRVEAVEIEGDQIFIAGEATEDSTVRVYIDNKPVGEARGTPDDRFLVSRRYVLEPGQHTVRADSIDNATGKVIARAEVPLLHQPIEDLASAGNEGKEASGGEVATNKDTNESGSAELAMVSSEGDAGAPDQKSLLAQDDGDSAESSDETTAHLVSPATDSDAETEDKSAKTSSADEIGAGQTIESGNTVASGAQGANPPAEQKIGAEIGADSEGVVAPNDSSAQKQRVATVEPGNEAAETKTVRSEANILSEAGGQTIRPPGSGTAGESAAGGQDGETTTNASRQDQRVAVTKPDGEMAQNESTQGQPETSDNADNQATRPVASNAQVDGGENGAGVVTKQAVDTTKDTPAETMKPTDGEVVETRGVELEDAEVNQPQEVATAEPAVETESAANGTIRTGTSIIIKPGDTLWQISRRTYGRGIRYTTIYRANRDQIRDPHWIYIGQIFKIPNRPDEELVETDG